MVKYRFIFIICLLLTTLLHSCYEEINLGIEDGITRLKFIMGSDKEDSIYEAYNVRLDIQPNPTLIYNNKEFEVENFNLRGESALRYRKKSFSVETEIPIGVTSPFNSQEHYYMRNIKLISLVSDYTYLEGRLSFGLLSKLEIQPLFFSFVEVFLNENTQGVYMLIEDPDEYTFKQGYEFILRRGYNGNVSKSWFYQNYSSLEASDYIKSFNEIYKELTNLDGEALYNFLSGKLNINNYFKKIACDYLMMNGDYSDEIFFIGKFKSGSVYFDIIPRDYNDIFSKLPHEVGKKTGVGKRFGERYYSSIEDIIDDVGEKLIFSIENDLDYVIARDKFLYVKYLEQLDTVCQIISENLIDEIFDDIKEELDPYYKVPEIIEQSKYGDHEFSKDDFLLNLKEKRAFLKNRLTATKQKVTVHKCLYQ